MREPAGGQPRARYAVVENRGTRNEGPGVCAGECQNLPGFRNVVLAIRIDLQRMGKSPRQGDLQPRENRSTFAAIDRMSFEDDAFMLQANGRSEEHTSEL